MNRLHMGMGGGAALDVVDETRGGKPAAAALAALQGVFADQFIPDHYRADVLTIFHPDRSGGAYIGAGAASGGVMDASNL